MSGTVSEGGEKKAQRRNDRLQAASSRLAQRTEISPFERQISHSPLPQKTKIARC